MILDGSIRRSNSFGANDGQVSRTTKIATNRSPKSRLTRFAGTVYVGRLSPLRNRASFCLGRRTNSDSLAKVGAPLGVALPKPGRVDQDKMECVKFPKGCHVILHLCEQYPVPGPSGGWPHARQLGITFDRSPEVFISLQLAFSV